MERPRIAIVDDDQIVRTAISDLLFENGFEPIAAESAAEFLALIQTLLPDLAIIDLRLRGESGLDLARALRARSDMPIVMLTGAGDDFDRILGLEAGADDYLSKPFNPRELIARVRAVLRRSGKTARQPDQEPAMGPETIRFGAKTLNKKQRILYGADGMEVPLTNAEYRLLEFLIRRNGQIVTRPELLEYLGSDLSHYVDRTVDVLILRLRRKVEDVPTKPVHLQTRRGQGYVFVLEPDRAL